MLLRTLIATVSSRQARRLAELLEDDDVHVTTLGRRESLWEALGTGTVDLLLVEEGLFEGAAQSGIQDVRSLPEAPEVVVFSESDDPTHRAELLASEAFAVLNASATREDLVGALETIIERRTAQARQELLAERSEMETRLSDFGTSSPPMREFLALVRKVVDTDSTLLVLGETGVGKEFLSRAIHAESPRSEAPFVAINCSALSESLLESELFGHVEGAFTGAQRARRGYFELAHRGTLFIDEVGELSPQLQVKLLRVIQERQIQPVGSEEEIKIDVRIIAATNRDLSSEMEAGRFRADLYYRLSVVLLEVPPLRVRKEDVPGLVETQVEHFHRSMSRSANTVSPEAMELLCEYRWPGNVRELINVIERAVLLCEGTTIEPRDLPEEIRGGQAPLSIAQTELRVSTPAAPAEQVNLLDQPYREARRALLEAFELRYIQAALQCAHGRVNDAARLAGINSRSLYEKMKKHGVRKEYFRV